MELQVEFAKNYCSAAKEPQLCLSPKNGNGDLVNRRWERVYEVRLGTDVCLQKCAENPENISSCRSCSCNKENGLLKKYVCRVMIGVDEKMPTVPRPADAYDQTPSYIVAMLGLSLAVAIPPGLPSGCFFKLSWNGFSSLQNFINIYRAVRILTVLEAVRLRKLSIRGRGKRVSPVRPVWLSYSMGHRGVSQCVRLTTYFHLVLMLRIRGSTPPFTPCFHGAHRESFTFTFMCLQSLCYGSSDSLIFLAIKLRAVRCGVRLPAWARHFSVVQNARPNFWVHPTFIQGVKAAGG